MLFSEWEGKTAPASRGILIHKTATTARLVGWLVGWMVEQCEEKKASNKIQTGDIRAFASEVQLRVSGEGEKQSVRYPFVLGSVHPGMSYANRVPAERYGNLDACSCGPCVSFGP